ncbi:hypothetical protein HID58_040598 [Brassica napus]|uniref:TF-B3 domain-containing protein n=1 Tax=Brassica napus TaxID=3708 RepID=A0ABQ8B8I4_BRANA|nr:hypothetical protein HID58_040598 [Brassica napus]
MVQTLDDEFISSHMKVLLISDASDKIWEVKLDGNRLAGGWEEFAAVNNFSDGNVLVFRHNGEEIFHVAVSSESDDDESDDTDDSESDDESNDTDDSESDDSEDNDEGDSSLVNKEADSSSDCFLRARVTPCSLTKDRLDLPKDFKFMLFDEHKKPFEIYLVNEKGRKRTLRLSRNISSGAFYITRGWANFCSANGLIRGDFCYFKLSESGERPVLLLCSHESGNGHEDKEEEECPEADTLKICSVGGCSNEKNTPSRFLTRKFTPSRFKTGQLYISMLSSGVLRESGIKKSGEITLLDNDGRKWPSYLNKTGQPGGEWCYIRKGWREMCEANGVEVNDSFVLELICEAANPIFKFHSKIKNKGKGNIVTSKKRALHARTVERTPGVEIDGERGSKRGCTRVSNRSNTYLKGKQPESCSVSDQVANARQSVLDTLNTIRHFKAELKTRERNLEASLLELDDLAKPLLTLDDELLRNHTKVLLRSDASDRIWKVKLDGNRHAGGWEEFAAVHSFSEGDVLAFRHDGEEIFHVAVSGESDDNESDDTDDSESDESDDVEDEDNDEGDILVEKNKKPEADTSTGDSCFLRASVTPSSLIDDRLDFSEDFKVMSFNKQNKPCEIFLVNEKGRKWTLILSRNISSGAFYIRRGWANFCSANGLSQGDICNFKLSESGERPVLLLCSHESGNGHEDKEEEEEEEEEEEFPEADAVKICSVGCSKEKNTPSRLLTSEFTPNRFKTGQLTISSVFLRESGINKSMEITLLNKDGRKWSSYLQMSGQRGREMFYMRKGWREMCKANGVEVNDSFVLELICEDATPVFKFHSKIENKEKGNTVEKTPEVSKRGHARVLNRSNSNLKRKQPESCSVSDQVGNVKQSIQDTLNTIRHFKAELKTRENNLEASLLGVDDLGERILGISKILNNNLV